MRSLSRSRSSSSSSRSSSSSSSIKISRDLRRRRFSNSRRSSYASNDIRRPTKHSNIDRRDRSRSILRSRNTFVKKRDSRSRSIKPRRSSREQSKYRLSSNNKMSRSTVEDQRSRIRRDRSRSINKTSKHGGSTCIGIFGMCKATNEDDLHYLFQGYGEIVTINIIRTKETNESRGFAFINYIDQESANKAIAEMNGTDIDGRNIRVELSDRSDQNVNKPRDNHGGGFSQRQRYPISKYFNRR